MMTPQQLKKISDKVYALWKKELQIERERRRHE